jgi:hypothetical protein
MSDKKKARATKVIKKKVKRTPYKSLIGITKQELLKQITSLKNKLAKSDKVIEEKNREIDVLKSALRKYKKAQKSSVSKKGPSTIITVTQIPVGEGMPERPVPDIKPFEAPDLIQETLNYDTIEGYEKWLKRYLFPFYVRLYCYTNRHTLKDQARARYYKADWRGMKTLLEDLMTFYSVPYPNITDKGEGFPTVNLGGVDVEMSPGEKIDIYNPYRMIIFSNAIAAVMRKMRTQMYFDQSKLSDEKNEALMILLSESSNAVEVFSERLRME